MTGIVNYGAGNIYSVLTAIKKCGEDAFIVEKPDDFSRAEKIILPGVGAFSDGMATLRKLRIKERLSAEIITGKPFLGICLGLQLLFSYSEEGDCGGLNLINGKVKRFVPEKDMKVPHMGWSQVESTTEGRKLFHGIQEGTYFYFAHSYYVIPEDNLVVGAKSFHGQEFTSVIKKRNIAGTQFHPEKSGDYGLKFLKNFLEGKWLQ